MPPNPVSEDIYVDFGVRKPHAILIGSSDEVLFIEDLRKLTPVGCRIYLEDGFPKTQVHGLAKGNTILSVRGALVKELREDQAVSKSDRNDVSIIRQLARSRPDAFREMSPEEKDQLEQRMIYGYYCKVTDLTASLKNQQRAFTKEFGKELPQLAAIISELEQEKKQAGRYFNNFAPSRKKIPNRGVGVRYLAGILIMANPSKFKSLSAYLGYCGLKASADTSGRYNKHVRGLYHQLAFEVILHKDAEFYPLYLKIKSDLKQRFPLHPRHRIDRMARNRVSTFLAKKVYSTFHQVPTGAQG